MFILLLRVSRDGLRYLFRCGMKTSLAAMNSVSVSCLSHSMLFTSFLLKMVMGFATFQQSLAFMMWSVSHGNQQDHSKTSSTVSHLIAWQNYIKLGTSCMRLEATCLLYQAVIIFVCLVLLIYQKCQSHEHCSYYTVHV